MIERVKKKKKKGQEVSQKETFEVRTKTGEISYNLVRSICFVLGKLISDMKCCEDRRRKLKSESSSLNLMIRKLCHLRELL